MSEYIYGIDIETGVEGGRGNQFSPYSPLSICSQKCCIFNIMHFNRCQHCPWLRSNHQIGDDSWNNSAKRHGFEFRMCWCWYGGRWNTNVHNHFRKWRRCFWFRNFLWSSNSHSAGFWFWNSILFGNVTSTDTCISIGAMIKTMYMYILLLEKYLNSFFL